MEIGSKPSRRRDVAFEIGDVGDKLDEVGQPRYKLQECHRVGDGKWSCRPHDVQCGEVSRRDPAMRPEPIQLHFIEVGQIVR